MATLVNEDLRQVPPPEGDAPPPGAGVSLLKQNVKTALSGDRAASLLGQFVASIIVLIAITVKESTVKNWAYGIALACVAAFFDLVGLVLLKMSAGEKVLFTAPVVGEMNGSAVLATSLGIWWGVGMGLLTFGSDAPFALTENGYFAVWFGFLSSLAGIGASLPKIKELAYGAASSFAIFLGLGVSAFVVGLEICIGGIYTTPQTVFGLITTTFTVVVVAISILLELDDAPLEPPMKRALFIAMTGLWAITAPWLTFKYPFTGTGNGYFGLWVGLACVSKLAVDASTPGSVRASFNSMLANERVAAMWGQMVAAIILIIQSMFTDSNTTANWGYGLSVGIVSATFAVFGAIVMGGPLGGKVLFTAPFLAKPTSLNDLLSVFLFIWWGVGAGILTIDGPYKDTGPDSHANGYFASWAGFGCSIAGLGVTMSHAKTVAASGMATLVMFGACAVILLIDICPIVAKQEAQYLNYKGQCVFALVIACLTIVRVLISLILRHMDKVLPTPAQAALGLIFCVLWIVLASWCTFTGPFRVTGNGYFSAWAGVVASMLLIQAALFPAPPPSEAPPDEEEAPMPSSIVQEQTFAGDATSNVVLEDRMADGGAPAAAGSPDMDQ